MKSFLTLFTTREQAIIIWIAVFIVWALFHKSVRSSIHGLIKAFLQKQIVLAFSLMFLYIALVVFLFSLAQLWDLSLIKDTIFWVVGIAIILFINLNKAHEDYHYFRRIVSNNFKFVLVLIFIINFYTFHLLAELILAPLFFVIISISVVAEMKEGYAPVKKIVDFILSLWGIFLVIFTTIRALTDYRNLITLDNLQAFLLPIFLTLALLPFLYSIAVFMAYEHIYTRLNISLGKRDKELLGIAKRKIFSAFGFNLRKLNRFSKENTTKLWGLRSEEELENILEKFERNY